MTKSYKTLIRLAKKVVEKEQEALSNLQARWDKFNDEREKHLASLEREAAIAEQDPEMAADFGSFAKLTQSKIRKAESEMRKIEKHIEKQREKLREAFAEQKKYEIALENKEAQILEEEKKTEQKKLDEVAIQGHTRKN